MMLSLSKRLVPGLTALLVTFALGLPDASAAENDFELSRYGEFKNNNNPNRCSNACGRAVKDEEKFHSLVEEFGQVMAQNFVAPSSTLGQAGTAVKLVPSLNFIDESGDHWQEGVEDQDPGGVWFVPALVARKGLPFSFEIVGSMSHILGSDMFTVGSQIKWALHEGYGPFPDVAARGSVNTLVGGRELQMITAGWDVSASYGFSVAGVMEITPYAGYQQLYIWGWSRLLNVRPQDPRAPKKDSQSGDGVNDSFNPEFVFDTYAVGGQDGPPPVNRFFLGTELNVWTVNLSLEGVIGENVQQASASLGMSF